MEIILSRLALCSLFTFFHSLFPTNAQITIIDTNKFIDQRDGNIYKIIKMNKQWWFAEDLRFTIKESISYTDPANNIIVVYYPWKVLMNQNEKIKSRGLCPEGWYIPSRDEWEALISNFGGYGRAWSTLKDSTAGLNIQLTGDQQSGKLIRKGKSASYWSSTLATHPAFPGWIKPDLTKKYAYSFYFHTEDDDIYATTSLITELYKCRCVTTSQE